MDSLTIYDGGSNTSPMMGKYCSQGGTCGNGLTCGIPPSHSSSSNDILIHLQSIEYSGFQIEYNLPGEQNGLIQSNLAIKNFLVTLKLFLNAKSSLSL